MILDSSSFPLFHGDQVLYELICPLTAVLPRIFFDLTTLSPIQFSFALFMNLLMLLFTSLHFSDPSDSYLSLLTSLLLSHRSRISAVTQDLFLLTMFAKDLNSSFRYCCVEGGDH